jgi:hypothetical protein
MDVPIVQAARRLGLRGITYNPTEAKIQLRLAFNQKQCLLTKLPTKNELNGKVFFEKLTVGQLLKKFLAFMEPRTKTHQMSSFFFEAIGTAATPGLLCQPAPAPLLSITKSHMTRPGFEPGPPRWEAGD